MSERRTTTMSERECIIILEVWEEKLRKLWGDEKYEKFATEVAKEAFSRFVMESPSKEFRDFVFENWDMITEDPEECN